MGPDWPADSRPRRDIRGSGPFAPTTLRTTDSLLADLALRLAKSPEDVATEGLAYVLTRSAAARRAVTRRLEEWSRRPVRPIAGYRVQDAGADSARPDLVAFDADGAPVVLFENKFWAALTPAQPEAYLARLTAGGLLCFVAPSIRLPVLWPEVCDRAARAGFEASDVQEAQELRVARLAGERTLVLVSWPYLLRQLRGALEAEGETVLLADLRQLEVLAARADSAGFLPLSASDLTGALARRVLDYCGLVDAVTEALLQRPFASRQGLRSSAGRGWYG